MRDLLRYSERRTKTMSNKEKVAEALDKSAGDYEGYNGGDE